MIYFFDNELNIVKVTASKNVISAVHEHELNGLILGTVETDLNYTESFIDDVDYFGYYYKDNYYLHKIKRVEHEHENELVRITGRHIFFEDMLYGDYIRDVRPENRDALYILNQTISVNTRWQTVMTDTSKLHSETYYWVPPMEVLNDLTENVGIEYEPKILFDGQNINGFQLHVANRIGEDKPIRVPFGSRVLNLKYEVDYSEIVTALYGHGKGEEVGDGYGRRINFSSVNFSRNGVVSPSGRLYMEDPNVTAQYGKDDGSPKFGRIIFEDIESASELADATYEAYLEQSRPKMLFEASVVDLGDVGMGDGVLIIRREYDVYFNARIHKLMVDLLDAENAEVELGDYAHFKESKVQRKTREKNNQYRREITNRIQRLKEQFNDQFDGDVDQLREEFEQALIDVHAEIEASEQRHNDKWEDHEAEIDGTIERIVGGSLDSLDTNLLDVNSRLLSKLDEADLQPLYGRIDDAFSDISEVSGELSTARSELQNQLDAAQAEFEGEITTLSESVEYIDGQLEAKLNRTEIEPIQNKITEYGTTLDANAESISLLQDKTELHDNDITKWSNLTESNAEEIGRAITRISDIDSEIELAQTEISANADGISGLLTRVSNNESSIADVNLNVDGITADFASYKRDIDSDVGSLSAQVASYEASVSGFRAEVGSLQGDIDDVDSWIAQKGSIIDGNADAIRARVWNKDIDDLKIGGRNLLRNSTADELSNVASWREWQSDRTRATVGGKIFAQARTTSASNFGLQPGYSSGDRFEIVEGRDYIISFEGYTSLTSGDFDYTYLMRADGGNQGSLSPYKVEDAPITGASNNKRYYFKLTANWSSTEAYLLIGARTRPQWADTSEARWIRFRKPQIIEGTKEVPYSQAPENFLQHTDFILESDGFFLGGKYVGGDHYSTAIVGSKDGIDILASRMRVTGDLLVKGDVETYALDAVHGDITNLRSKLLTTNVVESDHLRVNAALANKLNANTAFISRLEVQAANVRDLTGIHIRGGLLESLNGRTSFNLDTGLLQMDNTDFRLGGNAKIIFTDRNNRIEYSNRGITAGIQFDHSLGSDGRPMTAVGVSDGSFNVNDTTYRGLIVHSLGTEGLLGYGSSIISQDGGFYTRTDRTGSGINFRLHATGSGAPRGIYPQYTGNYDYNLGSALNPWTQAYIRDIRTTGELWIRDWNSSGGWKVNTMADSGSALIILRGVNTGSWNYNLGSTTYRINAIYLRSSPNVSSDERLKVDIKPSDLGLDFINGIEIKSFRKKVIEADINEGKLKNHVEYGLIAQQLRDNLISHNVDVDDIEMLSIDDDGYYGVQHEQLIAPTMRAVQELNLKVETNAQKIKRLEKEIETLKGA